ASTSGSKRAPTVRCGRRIWPCSTLLNVLSKGSSGDIAHLLADAAAVLLSDRELQVQFLFASTVLPKLVDKRLILEPHRRAQPLTRLRRTNLLAAVRVDHDYPRAGVGDREVA